MGLSCPQFVGFATNATQMFRLPDVSAVFIKQIHKGRVVQSLPQNICTREHMRNVFVIAVVVVLGLAIVVVVVAVTRVISYWDVAYGHEGRCV
jgi:hypothetical protein